MNVAITIMTNGEENAVWTTGADIHTTSRENETRISMGSAKKHQENVLTKNIINNNISKGVNANYVGVQSRFRRKFYDKPVIFGLSFVIVLLVIALWMVSFTGRHREQLCKTKECLRAASNLLQSMDFTVNPCDDFYQYACGNWAEDHPRPDSSNSFDWFSEKQAKVLRFIRQFLQSNGTEDEPNAVNMTRMMYQACMNTTQMDALGLQPVIDYLEIFHLPPYPSILLSDVEPKKTPKKFNWIKSIALIKKLFGGDILIGFDIFPDPTNRTLNRLVLGTPETTSLLPFKTEFDRKFHSLVRKRLNEFQSEFVNDDGTDTDTDLDDSSAGKKDTNSNTVQAYSQYITEVISAFVFRSNPSVNLDDVLPKIKDSAASVVKITKYLLKLEDEATNTTEKDASSTMSSLLNINIDELQNATDRIIAPKTLPIWNEYLSILFENVTNPPMDYSSHLVLTSKPDVYYLEYLMSYVLELPENELELYIWWTIVEEMVLHTTSDIRKLHNEYAKSVTHLEGTTPRSLYCTSGVNQLMGMGVSYSIAKSNFLSETKPKVQTMIDNIRYAFDNIVYEINWMDSGTKCSTLEKSRAMRSLIGFPEWILEPEKLDEFYIGVEFNQSTHLKNMMNVLEWQMNEKFKSLNQTEKLDWATTPTNVNAFHTFQANAITVPLAILQYPFYDLGLEALNYGAIGTILGHELTHGFDDSGRMFDKDGNLRQWWTNRTVSEYINRTECFIQQYSNYYIPEVEDHIDGELTLGENIADNGGLREAYYAYKLYTKRYGVEQKLPGFEKFTHEQLLFISFGNLWCETQTTIATKWALEDTHCPGNIRLRGVLENSPEFSDAFQCKPQSKMYPKNRCRIW